MDAHLGLPFDIAHMLLIGQVEAYQLVDEAFVQAIFFQTRYEDGVQSHSFDVIFALLNFL